MGGGSLPRAMVTGRRWPGTGRRGFRTAAPVVTSQRAAAGRAARVAVQVVAACQALYRPFARYVDRLDAEDRAYREREREHHDLRC